MATAWRLVLPTIAEEHVIRGSLRVRSFREVTIFGDDSNLHIAELGGVSGGGDEWGSIPWNVKYLWLGGHQNVTTSTTVRDLWLAHPELGITVEEIEV